DLADQQLLLELGGAGEDRALGIDDEAVAVKGQLVLAADQVAEGKSRTVSAGALGEHRFSLPALAAVIGRARGIGDQRGPVRRLALRRRSRRPDVLANGQADAGIAELDRRRLGARNEVALLVEDR